MNLTLNPFKAGSDLLRARKEKKLLGSPQSSPGMSEFDREILERIQSMTRLSILSLGIQALIYLPLVFGSGYGLRSLFVSPQKTGDDFTIKSDDPRLLTLRKVGIDAVELFKRDRASAENPLNEALLQRIEPTWRMFIQNMIQHLEKKGKNAYSERLYAFYKEHARPLIIAPSTAQFRLHDGRSVDPNSMSMVNSTGRHFGYANFLDRPSASPRYTWFKEHGMPYYEPESEVLYIIEPTIPDPSMSETHVFAESLLQADFIWFALHDAMTHQMEGRVRLYGDELKRTGFVGSTASAATLRPDLKDPFVAPLFRNLAETKPPNPQVTVAFLLPFTKVTMRVLRPSLQDVTLSDKTLHLLIYLYARMFLSISMEELDPIRPHLEHLVLNPHFIR